MRHAVLLFLILFLALPGLSQPADDRLIVPGERIGRWKLGVSSLEVETVVRPPNFPPNRGSAILDVRPGSDVREGVETLYWPHVLFGIGINDRQAGKAIYLMTNSREHRTDKNVGPGVAEEAVTRTYGLPTATTSVAGGVTRWIYDELGIAFVVRGASVIQVFVFHSGTAAILWKI